VLQYIGLVKEIRKDTCKQPTGLCCHCWWPGRLLIHGVFRGPVCRGPRPSSL